MQTGKMFKGPVLVMPSTVDNVGMYLCVCVFVCVLAVIQIVKWKHQKRVSVESGCTLCVVPGFQLE